MHTIHDNILDEEFMCIKCPLTTILMYKRFARNDRTYRRIEFKLKEKKLGKEKRKDKRSCFTYWHTNVN